MDHKRTILKVWNWKDIWGEIHIVADPDELAFTKKEILKGWETTAVAVTTRKGDQILVRPVNWIGTPLTKEIAEEAIAFANEEDRRDAAQDLGWEVFKKTRITAMWMTRDWTVLEVMRDDKIVGELHNVDADDNSEEHDVQVTNHLGNYTWFRPVNWIEPFPTPEEAQEALNYAVKIAEVWDSFKSIPLENIEPEA